jgi:AbrB family looped-hinge helix DNA binding protein
MTTVTLSSKFQFVIPREVRESMKLKPGQKMSILAYGGQIHLLPAEPIENLRGLLRGMDTTIIDDPDREFN